MSTSSDVPCTGSCPSPGGHTRHSPGPCGFEATANGTIQLFTGPNTLKVQRLRRDPRASIIVAAPVDERERWVSVAGHTTMDPDGAHELAARLAARYWDLDDPAQNDDLAVILAEDQIRLVIHPEVVSRFTY